MDYSPKNKEPNGSDGNWIVSAGTINEDPCVLKMGLKVRKIWALAAAIIQRLARNINPIILI
jgi:hypothetical protein